MGHSPGSTNGKNFTISSVINVLLEVNSEHEAQLQRQPQDPSRSTSQRCFATKTQRIEQTKTRQDERALLHHCKKGTMQPTLQPSLEHILKATSCHLFSRITTNKYKNDKHFRRERELGSRETQRIQGSWDPGSLTKSKGAGIHGASPNPSEQQMMKTTKDPTAASST